MAIMVDPTVKKGERVEKCITLMSSLILRFVSLKLISCNRFNLTGFLAACCAFGLSVRITIFGLSVRITIFGLSVRITMFVFP